MSSNSLFERFRPRSLAEVVGQPKAVALCSRHLAGQTVAGNSFYFKGPSGNGKTTLAWIMARSIADDTFIEEVNAAEMTMGRARSLVNQMRLFGGWMGSGKAGRAVIVNEAHRLSADVIALLNDALEDVPEHAAWFFTTTWDGDEMLIDTKADGPAFLSRSIQVPLTNQGTAAAFAARLHAIALEAGLNGCANGDAQALKIVRKAGGNMRAALQAVAAGAMMAEGGEA